MAETTGKPKGRGKRTTAAQRAKSTARKADTLEARAPAFRGWDTSDDDEIERRRWRGLTEITEIEALEADQPYFGTFRARSTSGRAYEVEIRSLSRRENSCDCLDWQVNGLGTCKHIEGVLASLRAKGARAFRAAARTGSPRVEVFAAPDGAATVKLRWPQGLSAEPALTARVDESGTVIGDPLIGLETLRDALRKVEGAKIRFSRHLDVRLDEVRRRRRRAADREAFLAEVEAGTASLDVLRHPLLPYQHEGMLHLAFGERALLADEMGLGKTVQAIAACELLRQRRGIRRVLVVLPASLKAEWEEQIARFTDLSVAIVSGRRAERLRGYESDAFFLLVNYEQVRGDVDDINRRVAPDVVVLDEAQRIKNWQTKTAEAVKRLASTYAFVLTGTPLENRIDEIYSIAQYLDPRLLGPLFRFNRDFYRLDDRGRPVDYRNLEALRARLAPVMLRRRKDDVEEQLPGRTVTSYFVSMTEEQKLRYSDYEARAARLAQVAQRRPLTREEFDRLQQWLACMRMICDSPYILDPDCRDAPKLVELESVLDELLAEPDTKVIVFSEWQRMLELVRELVVEMGFEHAWHTGAVPQERRRLEIRRFKEDPACRLLLSTNSGGLGLNLQVASAVVNVDLPWNPAQLEQRIARVWRKNQTRRVNVVNLICENSIEHRIQHIVEAKQALADGVLDGRGDLAAVKMPSGRAAMVERIAAMVRRPEPPARPAEGFAEALADRLAGALLAVERLPGDNGGDRTLVVLEHIPGAAEQETIAEASRRAGLAHVETIDRQSWACLRRLAEAGFVRLGEGIETLYRATSPGDGDSDAREAARRRECAAPWLDQGKRKLRLARHLADGGFEDEAVAPMAEAAGLAVRALAVVRDHGLEPDEVAPLSALQLSERESVRAHLPAGSIALLNGADDAGAEAYPAFAEATQRLLATAESAVSETRAAPESAG